MDFNHFALEYNSGYNAFVIQKISSATKGGEFKMYLKAPVEFGDFFPHTTDL